MVPKGWEETKLIDTSAKEKYSFTGGPFGSDLKSSDYTDNGVRIIQLQNIGDDPCCQIRRTKLGRF